MNELNGREVVDAIAVALKPLVEANVIKRVYDDFVNQNIVKPCAFIHLISMLHSKEMRNRADWRYIVVVRIHPAEDNTTPQRWFSSLMPQVIEAINTIYVHGQAVRTHSLECRLEDGVIHFVGEYAYKVIQYTEPDTKMESYDYYGHVKDEKEG